MHARTQKGAKLWMEHKMIHAWAWSNIKMTSSDSGSQSINQWNEYSNWVLLRINQSIYPSLAIGGYSHDQSINQPTAATKTASTDIFLSLHLMTEKKYCSLKKIKQTHLIAFEDSVKKEDEIKLKDKKIPHQNHLEIFFFIASTISWPGAGAFAAPKTGDATPKTYVNASASKTPPASRL